MLHRSLVTDSKTDTNISQLVYGGGGERSCRVRQRKTEVLLLYCLVISYNKNIRSLQGGFISTDGGLHHNFTQNFSQPTWNNDQKNQWHATCTCPWFWLTDLRWFTLLLPIQKQLGTYPRLYIHTLSVTIWQNNQNKKHMYKSCFK